MAEEKVKLNKAQLEAVEAIDGPVLVVAGPGTGKTQLLSLRVANILRKTDTDASNILCLTFTNKAATNMRERLYRLIGPISRNVVVRTFHSLAAEIMASYPDYFWQGAKLSVAPEAVQLEIIQNVLAGLPLDNPLASVFAGQYTALNDVREALKLAKEAGLTPEELATIIQENLKYIKEIEPLMAEWLAPVLNFKKLDTLAEKIAGLPAQKVTNPLIMPLDEVIKDSLTLAISEDQALGKTTFTGKWKSRLIQTLDGQKVMAKERARNEWWLAVADVYEKYREQLHASGYYDYSDMLVEVLAQLEKSTELRAELQERFLYVLIDEFQDTNAAQLRLAHLIADSYAANNRPNLMAVGDDDQSIFAFNGAELNNVLSFKSSYPDTKLIVLTDNYRSSQTVLDTASAVIKLAENRLIIREPELTKNLIAKNSPSKPGRIGHLSYPTRQHQQSAVVSEIKKMWDKGEKDIAVLARGHDSLEQMAALLLNKGLPVSYERQSNVLENEAVKTIYLMAQLAVWIADGDQGSVNAGIARLVRHPMWQVSPKTLWQLAIDNYSRPDWLASLLESNEEKLNMLGSWLAWLGRQANDTPTTIILEYLLGLREGEYMTSPIREYYIAKRPVSSEYLEALSAIEILRGLAKEFAHSPQPTLADFVRFIELNLATRQIIADESWFNASGDSIKLSTIHKAKGLEFDTVFVIDCDEKNWQPRASRRGSPANLRLESYGENPDDYVRLMYVAMSRAKKDLIATSYFTNDRGEEVLATPLLASLPLTKIDKPAIAAAEVLEADLAWPRLAIKDEKSLLAGRMEKFYLSSSSLIDFLNIAEAGPGSFLERHLLRLPHEHSAVGSYGTAIHAALETAQHQLNNNGKIEYKTVLDRFESTLADECLAPADYKRYNNKGQKLLQKLIANKALELTPGAKPEQKLNDIYLETARLGGKLDCVNQPNKNELIITDYKTGKPLSSFDTKDQTKTIKAWRHQTQLNFYCLLARNSSRYGKTATVKAQMLYVEAEPKPKALPLEPSNEDLDRLAKLAETIWGRIINLDFPATIGYSSDINGIKKFEQDLLENKI